MLMARLGRIKGQEGEKARLGMSALMWIQVSRLGRLLMLVSRAKPTSPSRVGEAQYRKCSFKVMC